MDKYFIWIHYERLHNHNKAKHNKTVCIFLGIYCIFHYWVMAWKPCVTGSNMAVDGFLCCRHQQTTEQTVEFSVIWNLLAPLRHHCNVAMKIRRSPRKYLQYLLKFVIQIEQQVFEIMTLFKNELTKGVFNFVIILVEMPRNCRVTGGKLVRDFVYSNWTNSRIIKQSPWIHWQMMLLLQECHDISSIIMMKHVIKIFNRTIAYP